MPSAKNTYIAENITKQAGNCSFTCTGITCKYIMTGSRLFAANQDDSAEFFYSLLHTFKTNKTIQTHNCIFLCFGNCLGMNAQTCRNIFDFKNRTSVRILDTTTNAPTLVHTLYELFYVTRITPVSITATMPVIQELRKQTLEGIGDNEVSSIQVEIQYFKKFFGRIIVNM